MENINVWVNNLRSNPDIQIYNKIQIIYNEIFKNIKTKKKLKKDNKEIFNYYILVKIDYNFIDEIDYIEKINLLNNRLVRFLKKINNKILKIDYDKFIIDFSFFIYLNELKQNTDIKNYLDNISWRIMNMISHKTEIKAIHDFTLFPYIDKIINYLKEESLFLDKINFIKFFNLELVKEFQILEILHLNNFKKVYEHRKYLKLIFKINSFKNMIKKIKKFYKVNYFIN